MRSLRRMMMLNYIIILIVVVMIYISYRFYNTELNTIVLAPYLDKPNYGSFYNPFIEDNRVFYLGQRVCCNGKKFTIVSCEIRHYAEIRITKLTLLPETEHTMYYNLESDGLVADSRCVKELVKVD